MTPEPHAALTVGPDRARKTTVDRRGLDTIVPTILALHVGLPRTLGTSGAADPMDRPWRTGSFKEPVEGPVWLGPSGHDGDGQADLEHHGGPDKAACVYPEARYPVWRGRLGLDLPWAAFGENWTVGGQDEGSVCVGDVYAVGGALVEVSQPRSPCWKLARRWRVKELALWVQETGYTGWYLRVLRPGAVAAGDDVLLRDRPHPEWTVVRANAVRYDRSAASEDVAALAACPALGRSWRDRLRRTLTSGPEPSSSEAARTLGENR